MARVRWMGGWRAHWLLASVCAAAVATALDAVLLQRARSYFTGGFLAADSLTTTGQTAVFLAGSFLADLGVVSLVAALALWLFGRTGLSKPASVIAAVLLAVLPLAIADFLEYQLARYLGDAFDLTLMFDLAGREVVGIDRQHLLGGEQGLTRLIFGQRFVHFGLHERLVVVGFDARGRRFLLQEIVLHLHAEIGQ